MATSKFRTDKALRVKTHFAYTIDRTFADARCLHWSHKRLLQAIDSRIWKQADYARLPQWAKNELHGTIDTHFRMLDSRDLHWRVRLDDALILGADVPTGRWHEVKPGARVWNDSPTDIYSDSQPKE